MGRRRPWLLEIDLVAHCGTSTRGFFLFTLCAVDVATSWVDLQPCGAKAIIGSPPPSTTSASACPAPLGLDSDNGSEFINHTLYGYCRDCLTFTRSRAWKKNDSAHVEQKNGAVVRHLVGYDRFASQSRLCAARRVYALARFHVNFFQPVEKLVTKNARAPGYIASSIAPDALPTRVRGRGPDARQARELEALYQRLNPLQLRRDLEAALEHLWPLAAPDPQRPVCRPYRSKPPPASRRLREAPRLRLR